MSKKFGIGRELAYICNQNVCIVRATVTKLVDSLYKNRILDLLPRLC